MDRLPVFPGVSNPPQCYHRASRNVSTFLFHFFFLGFKQNGRGKSAGVSAGERKETWKKTTKDPHFLLPSDVMHGKLRATPTKKQYELNSRYAIIKGEKDRERDR